MKWLLFLLSLINFQNICYCPSFSKDKKLLMSEMVFRHGDRAPVFIYRNTPCPISLYPDGYGALLNEGKSNSYRSGEFLRHRYVESEETRILDPNSTYNQVYVRSSDVDRCSQTVQALLSGFMPPDNTRNRWNNDLNWNPFAIHSAPAEHDPVLRSASSRCLKLNKMLRQRNYLPEVEQIFKDNKKFLDYVAQKSGTVINQENIWNLYQTLVIERLDLEAKTPVCGKVSEWATDEVMNNFKDIVVQFLNIYYGGDDREFAKLYGGPLLSELAHNIKRFNNLKSPKVYFYSGHDSSIYQLLAALKVSHKDYVHYLSTIAFEIYENVNSKLKYIEIYTYDLPNLNKGFVNLELPLCPDPCLVSDFLSAYYDVMSVDRTKECSLDGHQPLHFPRPRLLLLNGILLATILLNSIFIISQKFPVNKY